MGMAFHTLQYHANLVPTWLHQARWLIVKSWHLYLGDVWFLWYSSVPVDEMLEKCFGVGYNDFLPNPFQFIMSLSLNRLLL
jgi:hypothetical protein